MVFFKSFARQDGKFTVWEDVTLSLTEEKEVENEAILENVKIMSKCINNAKRLFEREKMDMKQSDIVNVARALFDKRASHTVYAKERLCREKFEKKKR